MVRRALLLTIAAITSGAVLAGCTSTTSGSGRRTVAGSGAPASSTAASTTPATSTTSGSTSSTTFAATSTSASGAPHSSSAGSVPMCTSDIRVIPGTPQGAAGHIVLVLVFNNVSASVTCEIFGYPGVDLVNASGAPVAHLARTLRGAGGGEPAGVTAPHGVILRPGQSASAVAEASDVPQGGITDCGSWSLLITVPNQTVSVPGGTAMLPRCNPQIHPVVPGTTGQG